MLCFPGHLVRIDAAGSSRWAFRLPDHVPAFIGFVAGRCGTALTLLGGRLPEDVQVGERRRLEPRPEAGTRSDDCGEVRPASDDEPRKPTTS